MTETTRVYFESVRDALVFAFNHEDLSIPGPVMNREMAQTTPDRAEGAILRAGKGVAPPPRKNAQIGGTFDRTVLAGWILQRVDLLPVIDAHLLAGECINPRRPCSCGRACCRGWSVKREWVEATRNIAEYLKNQADLIKEPGKRGFSTDPRLRVALIEDFLKPEGKRKSLADLADLAETTTVTVAKHRALIFTHLEEIKTRAWDEISRDLDQVGLVGALT